MQAAKDGDAVATARAGLTACWRSTVVPHEDGSWVVRTWTTTPLTAGRPSGTPDFVHRVEARPGSGKLKAERFTPDRKGDGVGGRASGAGTSGGREPRRSVQPMTDIPKVAIALWRSDAVVLYDWLLSVDLNSVPITHPAQKQALVDLLTRLESETDVPGVTQEQVEVAQAEVSRDMGWSFPLSDRCCEASPGSDAPAPSQSRY